jgi:hypothetical protein
MSLLDHMEYEIKISPDAYTYSILLNAWVQHARPGKEDAADQAENLLRRKIQVSDAGTVCCDDDEVWPNVKHWSSVLKAHAKTKSAGVSAMSFLFTSYSCCMPTLNHIVVLNLLGSKKGIIPSK